MEPTLESLTAELAKLRKMLKRSDDDLDGDDTGRAVPYSRFQQHRQQHRAALERLDELESGFAKQLQDMTTSHKVALKKAVEEAAAGVGKLQSQHMEDLSLAELGITDPVGRRLIREHVAGLPDDQRKEGSAGWLKARRAALEEHARDPEKPAPPPLPWLQGYERRVAPQQTETQTQPVVRPPPGVDRDTRTRSTSGYTPDNLDDNAIDSAFGWGGNKSP